MGSTNSIQLMLVGQSFPIHFIGCGNWNAQHIKDKIKNTKNNKNMEKRGICENFEKNKWAPSNDVYYFDIERLMLLASYIAANALTPHEMFPFYTIKQEKWAIVWRHYMSALEIRWERMRGNKRSPLLAINMNSYRAI